jgi:hypothetical protein
MPVATNAGTGGTVQLTNTNALNRCNNFYLVKPMPTTPPAPVERSKSRMRTLWTAPGTFYRVKGVRDLKPR